jgi:hypothetical protein
VVSQVAYEDGFEVDFRRNLQFVASTENAIIQSS